VKQYLYAIVDRLPARWRPPTAGIGGASVLPRRIDDLVVVGSLLDSVPPANPRTLALHQDVVATVVDATATLPFRYGTAVPAAELPDWLAARRGLVTAALASVRGCVEMTVKLLRLDGAVPSQPAGRASGHGAGGATAEPGDRELRALAEALAERAAVPQWRYRPAGSMGNVAAAAAFLVPRADLAGFLARIAPVASHAPGIAVVPAGPWAPYSFVPELDHLPPVRMSSPRLDPIGRRAG
jgi:gas vesicle protein GvpL/GvpF